MGARNHTVFFRDTGQRAEKVILVILVPVLMTLNRKQSLEVP